MKCNRRYGYQSGDFPSKSSQIQTVTVVAFAHVGLVLGIHPMCDGLGPMAIGANFFIGGVYSKLFYI